MSNKSKRVDERQIERHLRSKSMGVWPSQFLTSWQAPWRNELIKLRASPYTLRIRYCATMSCQRTVIGYCEGSPNKRLQKTDNKKIISETKCPEK